MRGRRDGRRDARGRRWVVTCLMPVVILAGGGVISPPGSGLAASVGSPAAASAQTALCADGRLRIGDLPAIDASWQTGLTRATQAARAWQADARLVEFQIGCQILAPAFRWRATFYSATVQLYYNSDTGETAPAEADPSQIPTLPTDNLSFSRLRRALAKSGFPDSAELSPVSGIDIRLNTDASPFGPPNAPRDVVYYHVAVEANGEIKDLFVSVDGDIYRYQGP